MNEYSLFLKAMEIKDRRKRAAFLDRECASDPSLRKQVDDLLEAHENSGGFLDVPALEQISEGGEATGVFGGEATLQNEPVGNPMREFGFLQPPSVPEAIGRLGHYDILEFIGRGGCGIVFKGFDQKLHRMVAIKVMLPDLAVTSPARQRFLREARATAAIRHENVVHIYAVEEAPIPFLVMEYIAGVSLQQLISDTGPLDLPSILRLGRMIAEGLEAAHRQGLIHRDIKPGNILIDSGTGQVKITDFGLARSADDANQSMTGAIAGTPLYMSPEQVKGERLDKRSDLFSLGSVLYVMCSGRAPFRAATTIAVLRRVADEDPRDIHEIIPEIPGRLVSLIQKLHAKEPAERPASAQEVSDRLAEMPREETAPIQAAIEPASELPSPTRARVPWLKVAAALLLLLSTLGISEATGFTQLGGTVIHLFSPEGTLVIEVDDPDVEVSLNGEEMVITGAGVKELRMKAGEYQLLASKDGEVLRRELVTVTRNGRQVLRISQEGTSDDIKPDDPDRKAAEYALSIGGKVWVNKDSAFTDKNVIETLGKLPTEPFRLTHVKLLENGRVTDGGLAAFEGTKHLRGIYLTNSHNVGDQGIAHLRENINLHEIHLWGTKVSGVGLDNFKKCGSIIDLYFGYSRVRDADMRFFRECASWYTLRCVMLSGLDITDEGLANLARAPALGQINLERTKITDAGLLHLVDCPKLGGIYAGGTNLTAEGIKRFRELKPNCHVDWKPPTGPAPQESSATDPEKQAKERQAFFDLVAKLPVEEQAAAVGQKLAELNPGFDGKVIHKIVEGRVVDFQFPGDDVTEIWPVRALASLTSIRASGAHLTHGKLTDLSPLAGLPLTQLAISNTSVIDLSPLIGMQLTRLDCNHTKITDLSPVSDMPLKILHLWSGNQLSDLSPLRGLKLTHLTCDYTRVSDLSPLEGMPLEILSIHATRVTDLSPLHGMPLKELYCSNTRVTDLTPLTGAPLTLLHTEFTRVFDLSPLAGMPLKQLKFDQTLVSDLSIVEDLPLEQLSLSMPLFHERDENLLFQLPIKHLQSMQWETPDATAFWREFNARKKAAEAFVTASADLPPDEQVKVILAKLREGASGIGLKPTVVAGSITEATLTLSSESHDISPLRAFGSLRSLSLEGGPATLDLSPIYSLPVESLECTAHQALRNQVGLREMPSLKTINGQPKRDFLKSLQQGATASGENVDASARAPTKAESEPKESK